MGVLHFLSRLFDKSAYKLQENIFHKNKTCKKPNGFGWTVCFRLYVKIDTTIWNVINASVPILG